MWAYKLVVAATLLWCTSLPSYAEPIHPILTAKHTFVVGAIEQDADASVFAGVDRGPEGSIDLGDLGADNSDTSWMVGYRYRLNDRWVFSLAAYTFDTKGSRVNQSTFEFAGEEFEAGVSLDTTFQLDTYIAEALYQVYTSDRAMILLGGGLHVFNVETEIEARVFAGGLERIDKSSSDDLLAPLPNLRVQGFYAITPKWAVMGTLGWLSINYDDYEGDFSFIKARASYQFTERFGVGVGYQYLDMDFTKDGSRGEAGADVQFTGPSLSLSYNF